MKFRISDDSDASWRRYGQSDPYYGVLTDDKYRRDRIDDAALSEFFETGEQHIQRTLELMQRHLRPESGRYSALDFGCGVGRLVIPLARRFDHVVGVDISTAYLAEAASNSGKASVSNVEFVTTLDALRERRGTFDFAHSYITFIHIGFERGRRIIEEIARLLRPGGSGAIHIVFRRDIGQTRRALNGLRRKFLPANWLANAIRGHAIFEPLMQANVYRLDELLGDLHPLGFSSTHIEVFNVDGNWHAYLLIQKDGMPAPT